MMKISFTDKKPTSLRTNILVLPAARSKKAGVILPEKSIGPDLSAWLKRVAAEEEFTGDEGKLVVRAPERTKAKKIALIGLGDKPFGASMARLYAARAVKIAHAEKSASAVVLLPDAPNEEAAAHGAAAEGAWLSEYRFRKYLSDGKKDRPVLKALVMAARQLPSKAQLASARATASAMAAATLFARDLVNEPASVTTPRHLADLARQIASRSGGCVSAEVWDEKRLKERGMGALLAVAKGSDEPPFMFHLTYTPKSGKARKKVAVVGKGLTFDSGGLSIKPAEGMFDMKIDMAGAAAVLGVFDALAKIKPDIEVHGIAGLCENMPSGKAVRPGDIVRTMSGKTVEVLHTDAEGRVTLADTLFYASKLKPDYIIDLATLTGACMVALGQEYAGLFASDDALASGLLSSAETAGELVWRMPLADEYRDSLKSKVADLKNISGGRFGGAVTAALFLKEFVGKTPWAHLDIAGPAWAEKDAVPHQPLGATGFGVRTVLKWLLSL